MKIQELKNVIKAFNMQLTNEKQIFLPFIIVVTYVVFLHGFFPMKQSLPGFSTRENISFRDHDFSQPQQTFDKVVILLIDALRTDFVFERGLMPFVKKKIADGSGRNFTLRAHPPTVTLPRIKAITTGSIPGFIDIVLNFDSSQLLEDNIISQAHRHHRRIVFYGDDTWIKLFPQHFSDNDGTTSFFVTDYTEVDDNVTRHIDPRLSALDWDLMILHYLGLDHIGHTVGPNSPLVVPKLAEMDGVVSKIYRSLEEKGESFVLLVCGDHGMSDQGSHGGASDREVFVPAVFISPDFKHSGKRWKSSRELLQIDLAPMLSMLMGLPIPMNNLGQGLVDVLGRYSDTEKLILLHINCQQVLKLMEKNVPDFTAERSYDLYKHAIQLHESYITENSTEKHDVSSVIRAYEMAMDAMATKISRSLTTYDMYTMIVALVILLLCLTTSLIQALRPGEYMHMFGLPSASILLGLAVFTHVTVCTSQSGSSSSLCGRSIFSMGITLTLWTTVIVLVLNILQIFQGTRIKQKKAQYSGIKLLLVFGTVIHSVSFVSSSFVEEEHQTWYFLSMTLYLVILINTVTKAAVNTYRLGEKNSTVSLFDADCLISQNFSDSVDSKFQTEQLYDKKIMNSDDHLNGASYNGYYLRDRHKPSQEVESNIDKDYSYKPNESQKVNRKKSSGLTVNKVLKKVFPWQHISGIICVMFIGRVLRSINQTGNKWLNLPDVGDWLVRSENSTILSYLTVMSLVGIAVIRSSKIDRIRTVLLVTGLTACYCYRISTGTIQNILHIPGYTQLSKGIKEAQIVYGIIFVIAIYGLIRLLWSTNIRSCTKSDVNAKIKSYLVTMETLQLSWILLMTLILRPHNTVLVAMVALQEWLLWKYFFTSTSLPVWCQTLICWWLGQAAFFQQGNSNSISTVDTSAGFVGLQEYHSGLAGILLYCSTYAGPVFWFWTLLKCLLAHSCSKTKKIGSSNDDQNITFNSLYASISECIQTLTLERAFTLCIYCIVVTVERYHLFVWTVFSPKLLYEGMLTVTYTLFTVILYLVAKSISQ